MSNAISLYVVSALMLLANLPTCFAQEADDASASSMSNTYEDNILDALHFRVGQNQFTANLSVTNWLHDLETESQNGSTIDTYSRTEWSTTADFEYGITDAIQVGLSESYLFGEGISRTQTSTGDVTDTSSNGFSDPTLKFNYRYWGGLKGSHFGSVFVDITPAIGSHDNADTSRTGNNLNSSTNVEVGTNLYWVINNHEFSVQPHIQYYTSGSSNDTNPANSSTSNAYFYPAVSGVYRFHFYPNFYLQATADFIGSYTEDYSYANRSPAWSQADAHPFRLQPSLFFGWKPHRQILLTVEYTYNAISETITPTGSATFPTTGYNTIQDVLTVAATYLF